MCNDLTIADLTIFFDIIDDLKNGLKRSAAEGKTINIDIGC